MSVDVPARETVRIRGRLYEIVDVVDALCNNGQAFHQHDGPHGDVPAGASHHHHTAACLHVRFVLAPVDGHLPAEIVVRQGKEWEAVPVAPAHASPHATPERGAVPCTS